MLGWFAEAPNPDHGLLAFRQVSEALGTTPWYLRALRDEGAMAERLARVLASSRYAVGRSSERRRQFRCLPMIKSCSLDHWPS
jgi:glutamine synthetase adenylyltransferase